MYARSSVLARWEVEQGNSVWRIRGEAPEVPLTLGLGVLLEPQAWSSVLGGPFCPLEPSPPSWLSPLPSVGTICPSRSPPPRWGEKARPVGRGSFTEFDGWATMVFTLHQGSLRLLAEHSTFWGHLHSLGHPQHFGLSWSLGTSLSFGATPLGWGQWM